MHVAYVSASGAVSFLVEYLLFEIGCLLVGLLFCKPGSSVVQW